MNILKELRQRFGTALADYAATHGLSPSELEPLAEMVLPSQDPRFGDYQANCAMPLAKRVGKSPRDVAGELIERLDLTPLCQPCEVAGPGFINLKLRDDFLSDTLRHIHGDARLGVQGASPARTFVIDYSAPNVAKPMHVGHIRSTVIGDSLYRTLQFLGHNVIGDNHLGDWGTQFGMILYGYRHFRRAEAYQSNPVDELARLYRLVNRLVDYQAGLAELPALKKQLALDEAELANEAPAAAGGDAQAEKKAAKARRRAETALAQSREKVRELEAKLAAVQGDLELARLASEHAGIQSAVLAETARLHANDAENVRLWNEFMPACLAAIQEIYDRLGVTFDHTLGESFYHARLSQVVEDLTAKGIARESDGAMCVFTEESAVPMIVRKKDGAFLYATSDLATIQYRVETWSPSVILYVVDHRQSEHFRQLFATARLWGYTQLGLEHVSFGTVLGDDGRPYKTRSGDTIGLGGLLDEAIRRAGQIVSQNDDARPEGALLNESQRRQIAEIVGIGALKYADLSQNRTSDYVFSYDKMLAMNGNTATYMQYAYARVRSIFRKGQVDENTLQARQAPIVLAQAAERALALSLLRFSEALESVVVDYRPNQLTNYLFELANCYSTFFDQCPVLKADDVAVRDSRLVLCDLTARTLKQGLALLGIGVAEQM